MDTGFNYEIPGIINKQTNPYDKDKHTFVKTGDGCLTYLSDKGSLFPVSDRHERPGQTLGERTISPSPTDTSQESTASGAVTADQMPKAETSSGRSVVLGTVSIATNDRHSANRPRLKDALRQRVKHQYHRLLNPNDTVFNRKVSKAAEDNDIKKIRTLYAQRPEDLFLPKYGDYDHLAIIAIMDDDHRLNVAMKQHPESYKPDLSLWYDAVTDKDYSVEDDLIKTGKTLTSNSKLIISGHGSWCMAGMNGTQFAKRLHQWLIDKRCPEDQTPRITLASCLTGVQHKDQHGKLTSFAGNMSRELARVGRKAEITSLTEELSVFPDGKELCMKSTKDDGVRKVEYWQGADDWLNPDFQKQKFSCRVVGITPENRRTDLVKVVTTTAAGTNKQNKYEIQGTQGLHSLIPPPTKRK